MKPGLAALLLLAAAMSHGMAQNEAASPPAAPVTDPAQVAAHYRQVLSRPEFQEPVEPDTGDQLRSWLSECIARFGAKFKQFRYAQEMPRFASLLTTVLVGAALVGLLYVLLRLLRRRQGSGFAPSSELPATRVFRPPEFYEEELRHAVVAGDWHAAWLASWRQFLSRLETSRLVAADRSRTNREYLAQLRNQPQTATALALVGAMVEAYDRFIYGRRTIVETDWRAFHGQAEEAGLLLHLADRPTATASRAP